jgi:GT2 family glycosyltransferase
MAERTLQIQTVLYNNELSALERSLESISGAIKFARESKADSLGEVTLVYGDSSQSPLLDESTLSEMKGRYAGYFQLRYTFFNKNMGTARGHNTLGQACGAEYMLIMNPDVIFAPNTLEEMFVPFADADVGLVEARQTPIEHPKEYDVKTGETGWATTACALFPTRVFNTVHGFDADSFFMYCDDLDFSWRIRLAGYKIIYQPSAIVFHDKRLSATGEWRPTGAERYYSAEAAIIMAYKWSNAPRVKQLIHYFSNSGDEILKKALNEFMRRKEEGLLPAQIDKEHKVAEFIGDNYSKHRFSL